MSLIPDESVALPDELKQQAVKHSLGSLNLGELNSILLKIKLPPLNDHLTPPQTAAPMSWTEKTLLEKKGEEIILFSTAPTSSPFCQICLPLQPDFSKGLAEFPSRTELLTSKPSFKAPRRTTASTTGRLFCQRHLSTPPSTPTRHSTPTLLSGLIPPSIPSPRKPRVVPRPLLTLLSA